MLALSDLFCEHSQFRWMFDHFNEIQKTHPIEDEMLTNLLRIGICKSIAVLGKNMYFLYRSLICELLSHSKWALVDSTLQCTLHKVVSGLETCMDYFALPERSFENDV